MGTWNAGLFSNDTTLDVKDTYIELLKQKKSNEEAFEKTVKKYKELFNTDEEPLFWYALADTQWNLGRLMPYVKQKAFNFIEKDGGVSLFESEKQCQKWKNTLQKLRDKLLIPTPPEKRISIPKEFKKNPWNIGDIYAYQFHTEKANENGLLNKYILFQKIGDVEYYENIIYSVVQVLDKVFDNIPLIEDVKNIRVLPLVLSHKGHELSTKEFIPSFEYYLKAAMCYEKKNHYPQKYFTYVGNLEVDEIHCAGNHLADYYWDKNWMEDWLIDFYLSWQNVEY